MKTRIRALVLILAALAGGTWYLARVGGDAAVSLRASGTVEARDADLGFQSAGRVLEVRVAEGTTVEAASELARIDARELDAAFVSAQAQLAVAEARLDELNAGAEAAGAGEHRGGTEIREPAGRGGGAGAGPSTDPPRRRSHQPPGLRSGGDPCRALTRNA